MERITLEDGLDYDFSDLKAHVIGRGVQDLLSFLRQGYVPKTLPLKLDSDEYFGKIVRLMKSQKLANEESEWLDKLEDLRHGLSLFDRRHYESLSDTKKGEYTVIYGRKCAEKLEQLAKGYQPSKGFSAITSPLSYFNNPLGAVNITDPITGISYPVEMKKTTRRL